MDTLIVGCGYLGRRVADLLLTRGDQVYAITRSAERANVMRADGINPILGDIMAPGSLQLPNVARVIYAVGFDRNGGYAKRDVYVSGLANVLDSLAATAALAYISSTSVYGQGDGEWVDEDSTTEPASEGGRICLDAEQLLRERRPESLILRLAGLYGPDRVLRNVNAMKAGDPLPGNPDGFLNLIHVDDAARLVVRLTDLEGLGLVLGADGRPGTRSAFYGELASLVDAPVPKFDPDLPTRNPASGVGKRCRSRILPSLQGFAFGYPTFVEGLRQAINER